MTSQDQFSAPLPFLSYAAPTLTSITGCLPDTTTSVIDCDRTGGDVVTIVGQNFGVAEAQVCMYVCVCYIYVCVYVLCVCAIYVWVRVCVCVFVWLSSDMLSICVCMCVAVLCCNMLSM